MTRCTTGLLIVLVGIGFLSPGRWQSTAPGQTPPGEAKPAGRSEPAPPDARGPLLETIGLLSGLHLYQTYLNIGFLADGRAERLYDDKAARAVLSSVLTPLDAVDKQLDKVAKLGRTAGDRDAIEKLRAAVGLLRRQGTELTAFWDSNNPADGAKYEATRREAWKQISALMGMNKK